MNSDNNYKESMKIYIYTSKYLINIAEYISKLLTSYNLQKYVYTSSILQEHINEVNNNNNTFIFLVGFQSFLYSNDKNKLLKIKRKKYILYQLEQINNEKKYFKNISKIAEEFMKNALYVLDYNIDNYNNLNNNINKLFVGVPIVKFNNNDLYIKKDIDILFYGSMNEYRKNILNEISKKYKIMIVNQCFGYELKHYISRSKIVLNIHYYENALLEICRIHEALPYNCLVISEYCDDVKLCEEYEDFCKFLNFKDINNVIINIEDELKRYEEINFDYIIEKNFQHYNIKFERFIKKLKYKTLFSKDLLNIKNSNINYELSFIDSSYNITNILQKFTDYRNEINIKFKNEKHSILYNDILKKLNKHDNVINIEVKEKYYDNIAHLHCYDLSQFNEIYSKYINNIENNFKIIITYSVISKENIGYNIIKDKYTIIKIENRGMDIGAKFCMIDYLIKNNITYKYILFLHSKKNILRREKYFSFVNDKNIETTIEKLNENYDGIFPNLVDNGDWNTKKWYINKLYTEELLQYLECNTESKKFIEGNCMILSYRISKKIFHDNICFYNLLNKKNSFDINWHIWYYKKTYGTIINNYEDFVNNNLYGNDNHHSYTNNSYINISKLNNLNGYKLPDGMIEHAFERIYLNVIDNFIDGKYYILNNSIYRKI
jgi:hypothetical protein